MKKALSILLLCAMLLTLCACGKTQNDAPVAPVAPVAPPQTGMENSQPSILPAPAPGPESEITQIPVPEVDNSATEVPAPGQDVVTGPQVSMPELPVEPIAPTPAPEAPVEPAPVEPVPVESETPVEPETPVASETPAEEPAEPATPGEDLMLMIEQMYAICGPQFMHMTMPVELSDAELTLWLTGVSDPALLTAAVVNESMMGAQAYSLVLARVADAAKAEEVANMMLQNIDPAKWICVEADDIAAATYGDLVMFIMVDSQFGLPAADMVNAFSQVVGGLDKTLTK